MKIMTKPFLILLGTAIFMASCKKEKAAEKPKTDAELILGTWDAHLYESIEYSNTTSGDTARSDDPEFPSGYVTYTFTPETTFEGIYWGDSVRGTYELQGNNLTLIFENDPSAREPVDFEIINLEETSLTLATSFSDSSYYHEERLTYRKW